MKSMRSNFKYAILMAAALTLGFSSCSNDEDVADGIVPNTGKTTAKITLTQAGPSTYAGDPTVIGQEGTIKSATLYIFNAVQMLENIVPLETADIVDGTSASKIFETTTGTHYVYAVVNAPTTFPTTIAENSTSLSAFEKETLSVAALADLTGSTTGFFMTNVERPASVVFLADGTTGAPANTIAIQVGRAVAKVNVTLLSTATASLKNAEYKVRNNPTQMYLMPVIEGGVWKTPYFSESYVAASSAKYFSTTDFTVAGTPSYAVENSNAGPVKNGEVTNVLISGQYIPAKVYNADGSIGSAAGNGTFYCIQGGDGSAYNAVPNSTILDGKAYLTYTGGISRYRLNLADNTKTDETAKYTVKRNSFFNVTIVSVSSPGMDDDGNTIEGTNPDPDPNDPDPVDPTNPVNAQTYINATISVLPWTVIEQDGGI